jgi:hypothetical protein
VINSQSDNEVIENSYLLKIRNKTQQAAFYNISIVYDNLSAYEFEIETETLVLIKAAEQLEYPVTVTSVMRDNLGMTAGNARDELTFLITEVNSAAEIDSQKPLNQVSQESRFFRP